MARDSDAMTRGLHVIEPHVSMRLRRHYALTVIRKGARCRFPYPFILPTITCGKTEALLLSTCDTGRTDDIRQISGFFGRSGCALAELSPQEGEELVSVMIFLITVHLVSEKCG